MPNCTVAGCGQSSKNYIRKFSDPNPITFHSFPQKPELKKIWSDFCRRPIPKYPTICSKHFEPGLIKNCGMRSMAMPDAIPTLHGPNDVKPSRIVYPTLSVANKGEGRKETWNKCVISGCTTTREDSMQFRVSFHDFPKNVNLRQEWADFAKRDLNSLSSSSKICSKHFENHLLKKVGLSFHLIEGSVPSIIVPNDFPQEPSGDDLEIFKASTTQEKFQEVFTDYTGDRARVFVNPKKSQPNPATKRDNSTVNLTYLSQPQITPKPILIMRSSSKPTVVSKSNTDEQGDGQQHLDLKKWKPARPQLATKPQRTSYPFAASSLPEANKVTNTHASVSESRCETVVQVFSDDDSAITIQDSDTFSDDKLMSVVKSQRDIKYTKKNEAANSKVVPINVGSSKEEVRSIQHQRSAEKVVPRVCRNLVIERVKTVVDKSKDLTVAEVINLFKKQAEHPWTYLDLGTEFKFCRVEHSTECNLPLIGMCVTINKSNGLVEVMSRSEILRARCFSPRDFEYDRDAIKPNAVSVCRFIDAVKGKSPMEWTPYDLIRNMNHTLVQVMDRAAEKVVPEEAPEEEKQWERIQSCEPALELVIDQLKAVTNQWPWERDLADLARNVKSMSEPCYNYLRDKQIILFPPERHLERLKGPCFKRSGRQKRVMVENTETNPEGTISKIIRLSPGSGPTLVLNNTTQQLNKSNAITPSSIKTVVKRTVPLGMVMTVKDPQNQIQDQTKKTQGVTRDKSGGEQMDDDVSFFESLAKELF